MTLQRAVLPSLNAFIISTALFVLMYSLIYIEEPALESIETIKIPEIINFRDESEVEMIEIKPERPPLVKNRPDPLVTIQEHHFINSKGQSFGEPYKIPEKEKIVFENSNQLTLALGIAPNYPASAISREIEGYAIVEFSVSASGAVFDARVVESEPGTIFDSASLKAIQRFKYYPKKENGKPTTAHGQRYMFSYSLD